MNRREALKSATLILGGTIVGAEAFLACTGQHKESALAFTEADLNLLNEIAEIILPLTNDSPGAKAANVGMFMQTMVEDCYSREEQETFFFGMIEIEKASKEDFDKGFLELTSSEKHTLLMKINQHAEKVGNDHYFSMMKQLCVLGYFSSEIGITKALRYEPVPGRYDGCVPYQPGEKAWAG